MNFVNNFQKIGLTVAAIVASVAFLFNSISPAKADYPQNTNATGKYMMHMNSFVLKSNEFYFHVVTWNTETGESTMYNYNTTSGQFVKSNYQLPN